MGRYNGLRGTCGKPTRRAPAPGNRAACGRIARMTAHDRLGRPDRLVGVVGTGTMGQGIAQVALVAGHPVRLYDTVQGRARAAAESIAARLDRLVEKGRMSAEERAAAVARLEPAQALD